jgi:lipoate-protein ligase A
VTGDPSGPVVWIDGRARPGWQNMAVDQAMLDLAESDGLFCWRLYRWDPHCLSFGRHEPARRRYDRSRIEALGIDTVRRPTGGRAVWHARELTYAVVAPIERFGSLPEAYRAIHARLALALGALGAAPALAPRRHTPGIGTGACFAVPVGGEIVIDGRKVVGSAQRRGERAFLQHGSILLDDDQDLVRRVQLEPGSGAEPPEAPLARLLRRPIDFELVADAIRSHATGSAGPCLRTDEILTRAESHYDTFKSESWTWMR